MARESGAMDKQQVRRANLRNLIEQWDGPTNLAIKLDYSNASYLVQMAGPHPTRAIGEKVARRIEQALELPVGWMDQPPGQTPKVDTQTVFEVLKEVTRLIEAEGASIPMSKLSEIVALAYKDYETSLRIRPDYISLLIRLAR